LRQRAAPTLNIWILLVRPVGIGPDRPVDILGVSGNELGKFRPQLAVEGDERGLADIVRNLSRSVRCAKVIHEAVVVGKGIEIGKHCHPHTDFVEKPSSLAKFSLAERGKNLSVASLYFEAETPGGACRDDFVARPFDE